MSKALLLARRAGDITTIGGVQIASAANNEFLVYDSVAGLWKNSGLKGTTFPGRSTSTERTELRAIKRAMLMPVAITDYAPIGTVDYAAIMNADALPDIHNNADKRLYVPATQNFQLDSSIVVDDPIMFLGDTMSSCVFLLNHNSLGFSYTGKYGTGGGMKNLTVGWYNGAGSRHGVAQIFAGASQDVGTPTLHYSPDFIEFENLNLTGFGGSTSDYNLIMDGNARYNAVSGTVPQGIRATKINRVEAFNAMSCAIDLRHVRVCRLANLGIYGGAGIGGMQISCTSPNSSLSYDVFIDSSTINGDLTITNTSGVRMSTTTVGGTLTRGSGSANVTLDTSVGYGALV